jgi:hypothetical protein
MANKLKTYRIWHFNGKPEDIKADRVEFDPPLDVVANPGKVIQRVIKFFTGRKRRIVKDAVMFTEQMEQIVVQIPRAEVRDLDEE